MGDGGGLLSYALRNTILAYGTEGVSVPGCGSATSVSISFAGISKNDTVLITYNQNASTTITTNQVPWVYQITTGVGFDVTMNLDNADPLPATILIEWVVLR